MKLAAGVFYCFVYMCVVGDPMVPFCRLGKSQSGDRSGIFANP